MTTKTNTKTFENIRYELKRLKRSGMGNPAYELYDRDGVDYYCRTEPNSGLASFEVPNWEGRLVNITVRV